MSWVDGVFVFIEGRWTPEECAKYSINVLELHTVIMGGFTFSAYARARGLTITHLHSFVDNTTAEHVAERGRTQAEALNELNQRRQQRLVDERLHQKSSRVASVFNDIADLLSRGDVEEALRFAVEADLPTLRLHVTPVLRELASVPATWT